MATCWLTAQQKAPAEKLKWQQAPHLTSWPLWSQESCTQFSSGPIKALVPAGRAWLRLRRVSCSPSGWGCEALLSFLFPRLKRFLKGFCYYALISSASHWMEEWLFSFSDVLVHQSNHFLDHFIAFNWDFVSPVRLLQAFLAEIFTFAHLADVQNKLLCVLSTSQTVTLVLQPVYCGAIMFQYFPFSIRQSNINSFLKWKSTL